MNKLGINGIRQDKMIADVLDNPTGVTVKFSGDIDMEDPSKILQPFFDKIHQELLTRGIGEVTWDFRELAFLNSSGIKALASWIMRLAGEGQKYRIRILQNKDITWQATSLNTLTYLLPGSITVE